MSFSYRPMLVPGLALATAGVVALGPVLVAPAALTAAQPRIPAVQLHEVQLAGIGQDIYYAITPYVQYAVGGVSYLINFIPLLGGPTAAQININYFQGIQPVIEATVDYLAAVVQDPFNFIATTGVYGQQLYGIAYNWVDAELRFFGLPPLPPLPPAAAEVTAPARTAAAHRLRDAPTAAAAIAEAVPAVETAAAQAPSEIADVSTPAATRPRERARATRSAAAREQPRAAAATEPAAAADTPDTAQTRTPVRAVRAAG